MSKVDPIRTPFYLEVQELDDSVCCQHLEGKDYLIFFGRLQMHKGTHILGQALIKVRSQKGLSIGLPTSADTGTHVM
jgi:hypothetical protein